MSSRYHIAPKTGKYVNCGRLNCKKTEHITDIEHFDLAFRCSGLITKKASKYKAPIPLEALQFRYDNWKEARKWCDTYKTSRDGLPSDLTESVVALCYGGMIINTGSCDVIFNNRSNGEVKGSSSSGPTSFSPTSTFDRLFYCVHQDESESVLVYHLRLNREALQSVSINKTETLEQQSTAKRRPRSSSMITYLIERHNIQPDFEVFFDGQIPRIVQLTENPTDWIKDVH